jgi:Zn-dependent peptidase ImmA (M78 family)
MSVAMELSMQNKTELLQSAEREADSVRHDVIGLETFPIDPVEVATTLGLRVFDIAIDETISGALVQTDAESDPVVLLNRRNGELHQSFTCAHEIGHFVQRLSSDEPASSYQWIDRRTQLAEPWTDVNEIYANAFAAALLMPRSLITREYQVARSTVSLAVKFRVPALAMQYRLINLQLL